MNNIYLKFYITKRERFKRWKTFKECFKTMLKETEDYYNEFGKDGFLSERIYKEDIKIIAMREAKREWNSDKVCNFEIHSVPIKKNLEKYQINIIENTKNFVRWVE